MNIIWHWYCVFMYWLFYALYVRILMKYVKYVDIWHDFVYNMRYE